MTSPRLRLVPLVVRTAALAAMAAPLSSQESAADSVPDTITGRVVSDRGAVLSGANVFVTRGPDRMVRQTTTDSNGRYRVTFVPGTGDYLVAIQAAGFRTARRRVSRLQRERVLTADFVLVREPTALEAIRIAATRPVRVSPLVYPTVQEVGASERWRDGVVSAVSPEQRGDLAATASMVLGVTLGPTGLSLLGSSPGSTLTMLNGMALGGSAVPRAARVDTRVTGATFDATRGGFAGANIEVRLAPGNRDFQNRDAYMTAVPGAWQRTDPASRALGAAPTLWRASAGADGELIRRTLTYNVSVDVSTRAVPARGIGVTDDRALSTLGVTADSLTRVRAVLGDVGLSRAARVPLEERRDAVTVLARLDDIRDSTRAQWLTAYGTLASREQDGASPLRAPTAASNGRERVLGAMWQRDRWSGSGLDRLSRTSVGASRTHMTTAPYSRHPSLSVSIGTMDRDTSQAGITTLTFGGRGVDEALSTRWMGEAAQEWVVNRAGRRHQLKARVWARVDALRVRGGDATRGNWQFASVAALERRAPASFTRVLGHTEALASVWNGATAFSHTWTPSRVFSLIAGARVEGSGVLRIPNGLDALGLAAGEPVRGPGVRLHVSSRVGFTYNIRRAASNGAGTSTSPAATWYRHPTGVLRSGIGEFRDLWRPEVFLGSGGSGAGRAPLSLVCVGSATPTFTLDPDRLPTRCADDTGPLGERSPSVSYVSPRWDAPRSWRASLDYIATRWSLMLRASALATYDLAQPSLVDRNFAATPAFSLADEGGRQVFVPVAAIDSGSGTDYWRPFWEQPEKAASLLTREQIGAFPLLQDMLLVPAASRRHAEWSFPAPVPAVYVPAMPRR
ncbi:MAG: carboxypeptidase-like regulatory domain-containing protein [Gemmatimonadaceae bacterium]|nr:carboxypeptidase-like regulatory domain-containing protein [Gemmatimonadaceae bacterium]